MKSASHRWRISDPHVAAMVKSEAERGQVAVVSVDGGETDRFSSAARPLALRSPRYDVGCSGGSTSAAGDQSGHGPQRALYWLAAADPRLGPRRRADRGDRRRGAGAGVRREGHRHHPGLPGRRRRRQPGDARPRRLRHLRRRPRRGRQCRPLRHLHRRRRSLHHRPAHRPARPQAADRHLCRVWSGPGRRKVRKPLGRLAPLQLSPQVLSSFEDKRDHDSSTTNRGQQDGTQRKSRHRLDRTRRWSRSRLPDVLGTSRQEFRGARRAEHQCRHDRAKLATSERARSLHHSPGVDRPQTRRADQRKAELGFDTSSIIPMW